MRDKKLIQVLSLSLGVLFVGNLLLAFTLVGARKELRSLREVVEPVGLHLEDFVAGAPGEGKRVFAFLSYKCPHCEADIPAWNEINAHVSHFFVAVCLDKNAVATGEFANATFTHQIRNVQNTQEYGEWMKQFKIDALPTTVVLDNENKVLFVYAGELNSEHVSQILALTK